MLEFRVYFATETLKNPAFSHKMERLHFHTKYHTHKIAITDKNNNTIFMLKFSLCVVHVHLHCTEYTVHIPDCSMRKFVYRYERIASFTTTKSDQRTK